MKVRIDHAICNSCGLCREVCPESAIRPMLLEPRHLYEVQPAKCTGCGNCLDYCPAPGALVQYTGISLALPGVDPGITGREPAPDQIRGPG